MVTSLTSLILSCIYLPPFAKMCTNRNSLCKQKLIAKARSNMYSTTVAIPFPYTWNESTYPCSQKRPVWAKHLFLEPRSLCDCPLHPIWCFLGNGCLGLGFSFAPYISSSDLVFLANNQFPISNYSAIVQ